jgi:hypothetical protein
VVGCRRDSLPLPETSSVIQDADLEYDPNDWEQMYNLIAVRKVADVVFGSRFYGRPHRSLFFIIIWEIVLSRFCSIFSSTRP